jgi:hypothetical protein
MLKQTRERGQALIEFILFLPFMLMMYTVVVNLGDAIHGSINQQKATRAYFYYRIQNSPQVTRPVRGSGGAPVFNAWNVFGQFWVGWADYLEGGRQPVYPCYRLNLPVGSSASDTCEESYDEPTSQFIRVGTVYGVCGATYTKSPQEGFVEGPTPAAGIAPVLRQSSCFIQ